MLQKLITEKFSGSQVNFCKRSGKKEAQVTQWLNGHRNMKDTTAREIESVLGLEKFFFEDISSQIVDTDDQSKIAAKIVMNRPRQEDVLIPQFGAAGAMGNGLVLRDQSGVIESWKVSHEWMSKNIRSHSGINNLCIVTGFGDSMEPLFKSGDPLLVDTGIKTVEFDATYFFRIGKDGFIKRLQRVPGDGIRAISENKGYDSWTIKEDMDFEVFGRVLKVWRSQNL